jgi:hypothetical protein
VVQVDDRQPSDGIIHTFSSRQMVERSTPYDRATSAWVYRSDEV